MRKVFLVTGFNNWGKTKIISEAFGKVQFRHNCLHRLPNTGCDFMVMPYSNDDLGLRRYSEQYHARLADLARASLEPTYILSAFCPTKELERVERSRPRSIQSTDVIAELFGADKVYMLLLVQKWCGHAELRPKEISQFYEGLANVEVSAIEARQYPERLAAVVAAIKARLP